MIDLRLPTGSPTTSTTRLPPSAPLPALPPPALSQAPNPPGGRPARRAERRRLPRGPARASVGRNVDMPPPRLRMPCLCLLRREPVGALIHSVAGMCPDVPEPHCRAVGCARRAARVLLLRSTSALHLRDAHALIVVQTAICESERI